MADQDSLGKDLQFERAIIGPESPAAPAPARPQVICAVCRARIVTEYFDVNGSMHCQRCRLAAESRAETARGIGPLMTAGAYGLGAGVLGAVIYYLVMAIAHLEIGIVAILIGYMVGYSVRTGARGRGSLRFQILAVVLTYGSIALAYAPIAIAQIMEDDGAGEKAAPAVAGDEKVAVAPEEDAAAKVRPGFLSFVFLAAFIAALPVLVVVGSLPSGLISAFIMLIGMRQAWGMTGAPLLKILGPYRVGSAPDAIPA